MNQFETFSNAPITEAIMDIKAKLSSETNAAQLEQIYNKVKDKYPKKERLRFFQKIFKFKKNNKPDIEQSQDIFKGYIFRSSEEKKLIQARIDGFTFNKLRPYESWDKFFNEGRKYWKLYKKIAKPLKVTRIALRYINRIEIPLPFKDFKEYILTNPQIAPKLPQTLKHYFFRLEIPNPEIDSIAIITQTIDKQTHPKKIPMIFDIDVIIESEYNIDEDKMWEDFNKLRNYKNQIFFNSITEKAKELFR